MEVVTDGGSARWDAPEEKKQRRRQGGAAAAAGEHDPRQTTSLAQGAAPASVRKDPSTWQRRAMVVPPWRESASGCTYFRRVKQMVLDGRSVVECWNHLIFQFRRVARCEVTAAGFFVRDGAVATASSPSSRRHRRISSDSELTPSGSWIGEAGQLCFLVVARDGSAAAASLPGTGLGGVAESCIPRRWSVSTPRREEQTALHWAAVLGEAARLGSICVARGVGNDRTQIYFFIGLCSNRACGADFGSDTKVRCPQRRRFGDIEPCLPTVRPLRVLSRRPAGVIDGGCCSGGRRRQRKRVERRSR
ncbi:unnamed protein product [Urochloa humidicola]